MPFFRALAPLALLALTAPETTALAGPQVRTPEPMGPPVGDRGPAKPRPAHDGQDHTHQGHGHVHVQPYRVPFHPDAIDRNAEAILAADLGNGVTARLMDVSLNALIAVGASTERAQALGMLQGGGHDPRKRGFTLQNVELAIRGAVDPYLTAEARLIYFIDPVEGESEFELEEMFLTTRRHAGFELEVGQMKTEFGLVNPRHVHEWGWLDQPIILTRVFGPDGMRGVGARVGWQIPVPWFAQIHGGVQNANGETMASFFANDEFFAERPIGGRPFVDGDVRDLGDLVYLARLENRFDLCETVAFSQGFSAVFGPNATGESGNTLIYGGDVRLAWRPDDDPHGWPFAEVQAEVVGRRYRADAFFDGTNTLPRNELNDWGGYVQVLVGFVEHWAAGFRAEGATGGGASFDPASGALVPREFDPFRDDRYRLSPLVSWQPTPFSRIRLQYNYDRAKHLRNRPGDRENDAHSIWLGFEVTLGTHEHHH